MRARRSYYPKLRKHLKDLNIKELEIMPEATIKSIEHWIDNFKGISCGRPCMNLNTYDICYTCKTRTSSFQCSFCLIFTGTGLPVPCEGCPLDIIGQHCEKFDNDIYSLCTRSTTVKRKKYYFKRIVKILTKIAEIIEAEIKSRKDR